MYIYIYIYTCGHPSMYVYRSSASHTTIILSIITLLIRSLCRGETKPPAMVSVLVLHYMY